MLHVSLVCARFSRAGSPRGGNRGTKMGMMVLLVSILGVLLLEAHVD